MRVSLEIDSMCCTPCSYLVDGSMARSGSENSAPIGGTPRKISCSTTA